MKSKDTSIMRKIVLITGSDPKAKEIEKILGFKIEREKLDLPELQGVEIKEIVEAKVKVAFDELNKPMENKEENAKKEKNDSKEKKEIRAVVVEDTGMFIEAWNEFPGALIKWMIDTVQIEGICKMLDVYPHRRARVKTMVGYKYGFSDSEMLVFEGETHGTIAKTPRGSRGFGYDKIFIPDGADKTFGEMTPEEKDKYSMRRKAFDKFAQYIKKQNS